MRRHRPHDPARRGVRLTGIAGVVLAIAATTAQSGQASIPRASEPLTRAELTGAAASTDPSAAQIAAARNAAINAALRAHRGTLPTTGTAQQDGPVTPTTPDIPTVEGPIPRTATSIPLGTAYFPGAPGSDNLADHGYQEEEYFLSGTANVYQYDSTGKKVEIKTPNVPYTTVLLVRRPIDPEKFSGRVQLEVSHPQFGMTTQVWAHNSAKIMRDGDAWVRIATSRGGMSGSSIGIAKNYNPERYAALNVPEDGMNWDMMGQIAALLKTNAPTSPLAGYRVKQAFMEGFSGAGAITLIWLNEFSGLLRMPDGKPLVDGFVVGEPSGYPLINSQAGPIAANDPRQAVIPPGVPVVKLHSHTEPVVQQRPDSDSPDNRYRTFEVAGAAHADNYTNPLTFPTFVQEQGTTWAQTNLYPFTCQYAMNDFPFADAWQLSLNTIERWVSEPTTGKHLWEPPHAPRLVLNPDGTQKKDALGNDVGGLRNPAVDVPTAAYYDTNTPLPGDRGFCSNSTVGHVEPFSAAELKKLYPTHANYVAKVTRSALSLEHQGFLLPADARATIKEAVQSDVP